jgi:hypothetical protein
MVAVSMLNILASFSSHIVFKSVGVLAAAYQLMRQLLGYKDNIEEQRATVHHIGFTPEDLDLNRKFDENDGYLQAATGALAIVNAYSLVVGEQHPLSTVITCGMITKSAYDLTQQYRKKAPLL